MGIELEAGAAEGCWLSGIQDILKQRRRDREIGRSGDLERPMIAVDDAHLPPRPLDESGIISGGDSAGVGMLEHLTQEPLRRLYAAQRLAIGSRQHATVGVDHLDGVGHREAGNDCCITCAHGADHPGKKLRRRQSPGDVVNQVDAVVVSVDYRMAPEHRAPKAVHDCVDAVRWLGEHAESLGGNGSRLAVSGDSAGGNLSAIVCQVVRDEGGPPIAHQALLYPATDATLSQPSIVEHADAPILTRPKIDAFLEHYLGPDGLSADDPLVSPLWATSHADLPPALVQTADLDPLRDEGRLYAERLAAAGVPVRHTNYVGVPHGFASFPGATNIGQQHRAELVGELRRHLYP